MSETIHDFDALVQLLYACVDQSNGFQPFLKRMAEILNCCTGAMAVVDTIPIQVRQAWVSGYPEGVLNY